MQSARFVPVLALLGGLFLLLGVMLMLNTSSVYAQDEVKEYYGLRECRDCHGRLARAHILTPHGKSFVEMSEDEEDQALILADFSLDEDLRSVQFPDEDSPRAFTREDVAYTLGSGRNLQAYVYRAEDGSMLVLPAQWNVAEGNWQALNLADSWTDGAYDFIDNCAGCHVTGMNVEERKWEDDGIQCEACHGPGSVHVELMDEIGEVQSPEDREALNASINIAVDAQVCGQCHAQGTANDGVHPYPIDYVPDGALSASFELVAPDDAEYWYSSGHASQIYMQYNEWLESGHASAYDNAAESEFFSLECLVCHGESYRRALRLLEGEDADPELLPVPEVEAERIAVGVTCSSCHNPHQAEADEDAAPIDTGQVNYELCTSCHHSSSTVSVRHHPVQEMFEGLAIVEEIEPVAGVHFSAENGPLCNTCHVPEIPLSTGGTRFSHVMKPVLPEFAVDSPLQDSCTQCHDIVESAGMQQLIDSVQTTVQARYEAALDAVTDDTPEWIAQSLSVIAGDGSWGIHNLAYVNQILTQVETELGLAPETAPLELPTVPTHEAPNNASNGESVTPNAIVFGLTLPALVLLLIALGIMGFAGWAFFFRGGGDAR